MKILTCNPDGGAFKYILTGINSAFKAAGNEVSVQKGRDVLGEFDLYIGCSGWRQNIPQKNKRKGLVGIHVNPYGKKKVGSVDRGPVIDESQEAIKWTLAQKPDFVFGYIGETFIPDYFGYWTSKHGIPVVPMPTAADIMVYRPKPPQDKFKCEIGWVGGKWGYKAIMLDKYMTPLSRKKKCLIYGWANSWGNKMAITDADVPFLFSSAKICPSVSEPHSVPHPVDVPERVFKVCASGGFTIHTPSPAIPDMFGDAMPMARDPKHWFELIDHYLKNDAERQAMAKKQRAVTLAKHTYFDRCQGIAKVIGNTKMVADLAQAKEKLL
jgi:hypothetical protein